MRTSLSNGQSANFQPVWAGDGTVYFVSDRSGVDNIWAARTARGLNNSGGNIQPAGVANADNSIPGSPH